MNWIKFKEKYLLSVNFSIMLSVILYSVRKDFLYHPVIAGWLVLCLFYSPARESQKTILKFIGHVNSRILLTTFYFLFFTPFSFFYRAFFRNKAFNKADSRFTVKESVSDFNLPF
jgi:hypothetical protein